AWVEPGVDHASDEAGPTRVLEVVHEGCAVLTQLLPDCGDPIGIPAHRGIGATHGLEAPIGQTVHGSHPQQLIENRRGALLSAVALTESCEGATGTLDRQDRRLPRLLLEIRVVPPT